MYRRILVPIDGSDTSNRGLTEAIALAKDQCATLRLLHVIDESFIVYDRSSIRSANLLEDFGERGEQILTAAKELAARSDLHAEALLLKTQRARVANVILNEAREWRADLIVMGTRGRRGFSQLTLGGDAAAVLHDAPVPVLMVRQC
jgi:nucleotide-binding universal stress UspA family protein